MTHQQKIMLGVLALLATLTETSKATVLNFAKNEFGSVPVNNEDLTVPYGSNVTAGNFIGAIDGGEGFTPNIALAWAPTGGFIPGEPDIDILELHSAATFTGAGLTVPVLQLDVDASNHNVLPEHPTVDFIPETGWAVKIHEFRYGNATDQGASETPHPWTFRILELPSLTEVDSFTTDALGPGDGGIATFDFTGTVGVSYRMLFDDGDLNDTSSAAHNPRTGIDNIRFSQTQGTVGTPGDFDGDDDVDGRDFLVWQRGGSPAPLSTGDLATWQGAYGAPLVAAVSVPEPTSGILLLASLALVGARDAGRNRRS